MWWVALLVILGLLALISWWQSSGAPVQADRPTPSPPPPDPLAGLAEWWANTLRRSRWPDLLYATAAVVAYWPWPEARPGQLAGRVRAMLARPGGPDLKVSHRALGRALQALGLGHPNRGRARRVLTYRLDRDRAQALVGLMRRDPDRYLPMVPLYQHHQRLVDRLASIVADRPHGWPPWDAQRRQEWRRYLNRLHHIWDGAKGCEDLALDWLDGAKAQVIKADLDKPIPAYEPDY